MTATTQEPAPDRRGPEAIGSIVKRYRKRDRQHTYGLRVRAYGERYWIPLGTERDGWNDVRAADRRDEIAALISRGAWCPPNTFELDPREKNRLSSPFGGDSSGPKPRMSCSQSGSWRFVRSRRLRTA